MNMRKLDLKDASGFGLLSTVIAMGIVSILIMGIMDLLAMAASAQRGIQIKADRGAFMSNLTNILSHDPTCTPSLKGNNVAKSLIMYDPATSSKLVAQAGMHFQEWDIASLELKNRQLIDQPMKLYSADVVITLSNLHRVLGITPTTTKQIATIYYTAHEGTITRCFGATNWAYVGRNYCTTMGGAWSNSAIQCTLAAVVASSPPEETVKLSVAQVIADATNSPNVAENSNTSGVVTGVDHSIGKDAR